MGLGSYKINMAATSTMSWLDLSVLINPLPRPKRQKLIDLMNVVTLSFTKTKTIITFIDIHLLDILTTRKQEPNVVLVGGTAFPLLHISPIFSKMWSLIYYIRINLALYQSS